MILMSKIYAIVTHHEKPIDAADAWVKEGVCGIGFYRLDIGGIKNKEQLQKLLIEKKERPKNKFMNEIMRFLEIEKGDVILAYEKKNIISAVGKVIVGDYEFNQSNLTGKPTGFNYPHQKRVEWLEKPREFSRKELPQKFADQIGKDKIGVTTTKISGYRGDWLLNYLETTPITAHEGKYNEELVKVGLSKYVKRNLNDLETGLTILKEEKSLDEENRPDFIAKDSQGNPVIIECKGSLVGIEAINQIIRYRKSRGANARCFLIAFTFDHLALQKAEREGIDVFEVDLRFTKKGR